MKTGIWLGCYKYHPWNAFRTKIGKDFPAKMDNSLLERIFRYLMKEKFLIYGDIVLDPMAGTGTTAIGWCAMNSQNKAITVELEGKYIDIQKINKKLAEDCLGRELNWTIIKGDARELTQLLYDQGLITVTSPPYGRSLHSSGQDENKIETLIQKGIIHPNDRFKSYLSTEGYGDNPLNIGNLDLPVTLLSPPYLDAIKNVGEGPNAPEFWNWARKQAGSWPIPNEQFRELSRQWQRENQGYSINPENIGTKNDYTYLDAMLKVYSEIFKVSRVCVTVTKNPTRNNKLVNLDLGTKALLEKAGFRIIVWKKAQLFKILTTTNPDGTITKIAKGRLTWFKRKDFNKGRPVADHEDILIGVK